MLMARQSAAKAPVMRGEEHGTFAFNIGSSSGDPIWNRVYVEALKADLVFFAKEILGLEIGPHIVAWGDLVASHRRIAINAARDHGKSTIFTYAYPIWRAWSDPGCEVYLFSNTVEQAREYIDIIIYGRGNLKGMLDIPELQHLIPNQTDCRTDPRLRLNKEDVRFKKTYSRIRSVGYGKSIRGRHPKYIVLDDPLNDEDMWSETTRKKNIEYFKSAITNMLPPDGQLIVVGTPYHAADLYGWLRQNPLYKFCRFPGLYTDSKGKERALFPWRYNVARLKERRTEIGGVAFAREILCQPISDDISIFPYTLFPPCFDHQAVCKIPGRQLHARGLRTYMGIDIARSSSVGADYFVIFVMAHDPKDGTHYVVDIRRSRGLAFRDQLDEIKLAAQIYEPDLIFIESNAMQQVYTDEMRRSTDLPVKEFVTLATNKYPLDRGVPGLRILLENRKIVIPRGDEESRKITDIWIDEAIQFGYIEGKLQGIGAHDDCVMAWWFVCEAIKHGGFSFAFGDDGDGDDEEEGGGESWEQVMLGDAGETEVDGGMF
jgi:hypothetical protein